MRSALSWLEGEDRLIRGWSFGGIQYAPSASTTYWSLSWSGSRLIFCLRAVKVLWASGCVSFCRAWPPNCVKSVPLGIKRAALSGRLLETRPGVCLRCTQVSVSQMGSWLVHEAPWWPRQDRGQKEPCSCACLQLHSSIGAICGFVGRVERRRGGWCWLVLDGPPSDSSMWSTAAVQQLHVQSPQSLHLVVCGCVRVYASPCLFSGASSSSSCTSIIMVGGRRRRLSRLWGSYHHHHSFRRSC